MVLNIFYLKYKLGGTLISINFQKTPKKTQNILIFHKNNSERRDQKIWRYTWKKLTAHQMRNTALTTMKGKDVQMETE